MENKTVLIFEDEPEIIQLLTYNLVKQGYDVMSKTTGENALQNVKALRPDLILLDIMLPIQDGHQICCALREDRLTKDIPIIILSAKSETTDIITGLDLGADDYVTKPFNLDELLARINVKLRDTSKRAYQDILIFGELHIHVLNYEVSYEGEKITLSYNEFQALLCLVSQPKRVFNRQQIMDFMHGEDYVVNDRLIDVLIAGIRKKLKGAASYIKTVRGVGYKFDDQNA